MPRFIPSNIGSKFTGTRSDAISAPVLAPF
jgi:hypothetical protein